MTKDEIKAYAKEMIETAGLDSASTDHAPLRTAITQQAMAICGMPFDGPVEKAHALNQGAGPMRVRGTH